MQPNQSEHSPDTIIFTTSARQGTFGQRPVSIIAMRRSIRSHLHAAMGIIHQAPSHRGDTTRQGHIHRRRKGAATTGTGHSLRPSRLPRTEECHSSAVRVKVAHTYRLIAEDIVLQSPRQDDLSQFIRRAQLPLEPRLKQGRRIFR